MEVILIQEYKEMHKLRNNYSWIHSESYWLGSSFGTSDNKVISVADDIFFQVECILDGHLGVRPVIEFTLE